MIYCYSIVSHHSLVLNWITSGSRVIAPYILLPSNEVEEATLNSFSQNKSWITFSWHKDSRPQWFLEGMLSCDDSKSTACKLVGAASGDDVFNDWRASCNVLSTSVEQSELYDLKNNPGKYLNATLRMCQAMEQGTRYIFFALVLGMFHVMQNLTLKLVPYKEGMEARKLREDYNDWVWQKVLQNLS